MGEQETHPTLKEHHEKLSAAAKVIIGMISVCMALEAVDITSTFIFRHSTAQGITGVISSVSSLSTSLATVSAESRITAKRLDEFIEMSKKRWTFLREDNEGKITVSAMTPEEVDLENARARRRPSPTASPAPSHKRHRAAPSPSPRKKYWWE